MFLALSVLSKLGKADTALNMASKLTGSKPKTSLPKNTSSQLNKTSNLISTNGCTDVLSVFYKTMSKIYGLIPLWVIIIFIIITILFGLSYIFTDFIIDLLDIHPVDQILEFIYGWWDVDEFGSCEVRFANPSINHGNDLSLWQKGNPERPGMTYSNPQGKAKETNISKNDQTNSLYYCSQVQINPPNWYWYAEDETEPNNDWYCGDIDELELNASNKYCGETPAEKLVGYFTGEQIETNAPRKYLECIYLNEKNCEGESNMAAGGRLNYTPKIFGRGEGCKRNAGGLDYINLKNQAKNSIIYRIYKEENDKTNRLLQMKGPPKCKDIQTLELEKDSPSKGDCFGPFKPNCDIGGENIAIKVIRISYYIIISIWFIIIIDVLLLIYFTISNFLMEQIPSLQCKK